MGETFPGVTPPIVPIPGSILVAVGIGCGIGVAVGVGICVGVCRGFLFRVVEAPETIMRRVQGGAG